MTQTLHDLFIALNFSEKEAIARSQRDPDVACYNQMVYALLAKVSGLALTGSGLANLNAFSDYDFVYSGTCVSLLSKLCLVKDMACCQVSFPLCNLVKITLPGALRLSYDITCKNVTHETALAEIRAPADGLPSLARKWFGLFAQAVDSHPIFIRYNEDTTALIQAMYMGLGKRDTAKTTLFLLRSLRRRADRVPTFVLGFMAFIAHHYAERVSKADKIGYHIMEAVLALVDLMLPGSGNPDIGGGAVMPDPFQAKFTNVMHLAFVPAMKELNLGEMRTPEQLWRHLMTPYQWEHFQHGAVGMREYVFELVTREELLQLASAHDRMWLTKGPDACIPAGVKWYMVCLQISTYIMPYRELLAILECPPKARKAMLAACALSMSLTVMLCTGTFCEVQTYLHSGLAQMRYFGARHIGEFVGALPRNYGFDHHVSNFCKSIQRVVSQDLVRRSQLFFDFAHMGQWLLSDDWSLVVLVQATMDGWYHKTKGNPHCPRIALKPPNKGGHTTQGNKALLKAEHLSVSVGFFNWRQCLMNRGVPPENMEAERVKLECFNALNRLDLWLVAREGIDPKTERYSAKKERPDRFRIVKDYVFVRRSPFDVMPNPCQPGRMRDMATLFDAEPFNRHDGRLYNGAWLMLPSQEFDAKLPKSEPTPAEQAEAVQRRKEKRMRKDAIRAERKAQRAAATGPAHNDGVHQSSDDDDDDDADSVDPEDDSGSASEAMAALALTPEPGRRRRIHRGDASRRRHRLAEAAVLTPGSNQGESEAGEA